MPALTRIEGEAEFESPHARDDRGEFKLKSIVARFRPAAPTRMRFKVSRPKRGELKVGFCKEGVSPIRERRLQEFRDRPFNI